jgi:hypothetical protein
MKFQVMLWHSWEAPVTVLGDVVTESRGAAIRLGVRRWPQLTCENFYLIEKGWTTPSEPWVMKPLASGPAGDPYG